MSKKNHARTSLVIVQKHFPKVETISDGDKPILIEVTPMDNTSKAVKNPLICAFARACQRVFTADGVIIGLTISYIVKGKKAIRYKNPESVSREIVSFDRRAGFTPGVYQLSAINPASRLGVPHRGGTNSGTGKRRHRHVTARVRVISEIPFER
jgi:hypothetical protein